MRKLPLRLALLALLAGLACAAPRAVRRAPAPAGARPPFSSAPASAPAGTPEDHDGDGAPDAWVTRQPDGSVSRLAYDLDRDGAADVALVFEDGVLVRKELAFRVEGVPPTWSVFERGELVRKERDTDGDGRPDLWERYERGSLVGVEHDTDGDGTPDRVEPATPGR